MIESGIGHEFQQITAQDGIIHVPNGDIAASL